MKSLLFDAFASRCVISSISSILFLAAPLDRVRSGAPLAWSIGWQISVGWARVGDVIVVDPPLVRTTQRVAVPLSLALPLFRRPMRMQCFHQPQQSHDTALDKSQMQAPTAKVMGIRNSKEPFLALIMLLTVHPILVKMSIAVNEIHEASLALSVLLSYPHFLLLPGVFFFFKSVPSSLCLRCS
jgi:hypothetical protein